MSEFRLSSFRVQKTPSRLHPVYCKRPVLCAHRLTTKKPSEPPSVPIKPPPTSPKLVSLSTASKAQGLQVPLVHKLTSKWDSIPARYQIVAFLCGAFVLCNMDKVNLSLAIIPMAREYNWPGSVSGLIQSSFFWGYMLSQIPGGYLCARFGGRRVLPYAVSLWTLAIGMIPFVGGTVSGLCLARASVGLAEAVTPSAITDMVARTVPKEERSRTMSFIFAGLSGGSIVGLFLAPFLIERFDWESVFLAFAIGSAFWIFGFERLMTTFRAKEPSISQKLMTKTSQGKQKQDQIPIRGILRSTPVRALAFTHFCGNYFHYTMLSWLPSYFTQTLNLDLNHAALVSLFPPILSITFAGIAGSSADKLISFGWSPTRVRKLSQSIAFLGPASCLLGASFSDQNPTLSAGLVTLSLGLAAFSMAGLYCNHQDLSPKYSSFLLGLTNTAASIPGIIGVWLTGYLMDQFNSWELALFLPSIVFFVAGTVVFLKFGSAEQEVFTNNEIFEVELSVQQFLRRLKKQS